MKRQNASINAYLDRRNILQQFARRSCFAHYNLLNVQDCARIEFTMLGIDTVPIFSQVQNSEHG
jgi:hypothetical protein